MDWKEYFNTMSDWKKLPAYKAEPRIDSFIGYYLTKFMSNELGVNILGIIPELPIRVGTVKPVYQDTKFADSSYKVDFYLLDSLGKNYFIEFKSDSSSRNEKQDVYLREAKCFGMGKIVQGIVRIAQVSPYKNKYAHLLDKLTKLNLISSTQAYTGISNDIEVVYVQPHQTNSSDKCIDFQQIARWLLNTFKESEFETQFANKLIEWSTD
jgi:hypothetical protein